MFLKTTCMQHLLGAMILPQMLLCTLIMNCFSPFSVLKERCSCFYNIICLTGEPRVCSGMEYPCMTNKWHFKQFNISLQACGCVCVGFHRSRQIYVVLILEPYTRALYLSPKWISPYRIRTSHCSQDSPFITFTAGIDFSLAR